MHLKFFIRENTLENLLISNARLKIHAPMYMPNFKTIIVQHNNR